MHASGRDIWNIIINLLDLKTDFLRQQLQNQVSQPEVEAHMLENKSTALLSLPRKMPL
jgi:hypothetical protein